MEIISLAGQRTDEAFEEHDPAATFCQRVLEKQGGSRLDNGEMRMQSSDGWLGRFACHVSITSLEAPIARL